MNDATPLTRPRDEPVPSPRVVVLLDRVSLGGRSRHGGRNGRAPRGPLAPRRPGSDARRRDRDEQEGDEQEPAGTGRRGRRGERARRRWSAESSTGWRGIAGAGLARCRGIARAAWRDSRDARRTEGPGRCRGARAHRRRLSSRPWRARRSGAPSPLAGDAASPTGTGPVADGTASTYWAIAASDGAVGGGAPAIAGDASTTATPAEQVAAMSIRIGRTTLASRGRGCARAGPGRAGFLSDVGLTLLLGGVFFVLAYRTGATTRRPGRRRRARLVDPRTRR